MEEDPRLFDNVFFGLSPKEAQSMDPQQRLLLETVYEGVEAAGYSIPCLRGSNTAVFVGRSSTDYVSMMGQDLDSWHQYGLTGTAASILANRISYFFDWKGPSLALDTAWLFGPARAAPGRPGSPDGRGQGGCRSGNEYVARARGLCRTVSGTWPIDRVDSTRMADCGTQLHMLSPTGKSHMWDASADGFTRGEGIGAVILKPLSQALADNDHIESIVRNTATNQDGRTRGMFDLPLLSKLPTNANIFRPHHAQRRNVGSTHPVYLRQMWPGLEHPRAPTAVI